ncbi:ubiquitin [Priestia flexa]|jgi:uncharacterized ubiquitin-like protein YukD|uniref:Ubiquitin n=2 Tax=Priestia TaxID=2800373 RepID=A0A0V8JHB1_9BACI|nr:MULTISPECIES: EsaB/YukD family protein [Bacillaceae]AQX56215.1 ubiquitin [Priestia flexa]KSU86436.1 ubiquitin [Priestia veravalensis]KZB90537.1 ubiquitin [Bacillus sp. VT 712]MBN8252742.1 ubiquitin [Priestia flexa]MBN8435889.1 ubiquitin [Priestia flexa]
MYIEVTIDLKHYTGERFDLRLSDYHSVKKVIEIAWQAKKISSTPKEGYWVRVPNKNLVFAGHQKLNECGISSGDCIEIL